jgi:prepilin-type N-terminal cleavage/methylation domain-containing protein
MKATCTDSISRRHAAYTLVEVMIASMVIGIMLVSLYGAFAAGFSVIKASREKFRATQILLQKLEALRFCTWTQLNSFPGTFTEPYDPTSKVPETIPFYSGTVAFGAAGMIPDTAPYKTNMQQVTVTICWTNFDGSLPRPHSEQITTLIGRYGAQNYAAGK